MKNLVFLSLMTLFVACLFTACEKEQVLESENQLTSETLEFRRGAGPNPDCPRQDIEVDVPGDFDELIDELNTVVRCGDLIASLDCGDDAPPATDFASVLVEEWCYTTSPGSCDCNDYPSIFTVADQDELIDDARTLLNAALTTCNVTNDASITFVEHITNVATCEDIKIRLYARARTECCAK